MKVYIERTKEEQELIFTGTVKELLQQLKILPEEVLVVKEGELLTEDEELQDEDEVRLLSVVSGG